MSNFHDVLARFIQLLEERLRLTVLTKEDAMRYTFFLALTETSFCRHTDVILEMPHDTIDGKEVDTYIQGSNGRSPILIEFKYDRRYNATLNTTHKAGAIFNDMCRLAHIQEQERLQRYFVYLTDEDMKAYFSNPRHGMENVFDLQDEVPLHITDHFISTKTHTFKKVVEQHFCEFCLTNVLSVTMSNQHHLRVYAVSHPIV